MALQHIVKYMMEGNECYWGTSFVGSNEKKIAI